MKDSVLFCIPIKPNHLDQFKQFVKDTGETKAEEWKAMFVRYDIHNVKVWYKTLQDTDYAMVYHEVGPSFADKIQGWDHSDHPFDQWFNQQIMAVYDTGPVGAGATLLHVLEVD